MARQVSLTIGQFRSVEKIFNSPLVKKYRVSFSTSQAVDITLAFPYRETLPQPICIQITSKLQFFLTKIQEEQHYVTILAIRKLTNSLFGEKIQDKYLFGFDGIIYQNHGYLIGGYLREHLQDLSFTEDILLPSNNDTSQRTHPRKVLQRLKTMLANYHSLNIAMNSIENKDLKWRTSTQEPVLRVSDHATIELYSQGHLIWQDKLSNPYRQDQKQLQAIIYSLLQQSSSLNTYTKITNTLERKQMFNQFSNDLQLVNTLYTQTYQAFKVCYQKIYNVPFQMLGQGKKWAEKIKQHYQMAYSRDQLAEFLREELENRKQMIGSNWQALKELETIAKQYQHFLSSQPRKSSAHSLLEDLKRAEGVYYSSLYNFTLPPSGYQPILLQKIAASIPKTNPHQLLLWHFLKAKISGRDGNFYRGLAHLRAAKKFANHKQELSVLLLEEGRYYQYIGQVELADKHYRDCIVLREQIYGTLHPKILPPLYNLLLLYLKQNNKHENISIFRGRIEVIRSKWTDQQLNEIIELKGCWIIEQQYQEWQGKANPVKGDKLMNKEQLPKIQAIRMPIISKIYPSKANLNQSAISLLQQQSYLNEFSSLAALYLIAKAITTDRQLNNSQIKYILISLPMLKSCFVKNYHRLLFCLSFYWEKQLQLSKSLQCLKELLQTIDKCNYQRAVKYSVQKRYTYLLKITSNKKQLMRYYLHNDMANRGDLCQLLDCICLSFQEGYHFKCIMLGQRYLNMIAQYPTEPEVQNYTLGGSIVENKMAAKGKLVDHSFSVRMVMAKAFIELAQYEEALENLKRLYVATMEIRRLRELAQITVRLVQCVWRDEQYQFVLKGLNLLLVEVDIEQQKQEKQCTLDCIMSLLSVQQQQLGIQTLIKTLQKIHSQDISTYLRFISYYYKQEQSEMKTTYLESFGEQQSWKQLRIILSRMKQQTTIKSQQITITSQEFQKQICRMAKQAHTSFYNLLSLLTQFLYNHSTSFAIELIIKLMINHSSQWGKHSTFIIWLHILLLKLASELDQKCLELQLLYWLCSFNKDVDIKGSVSDVWASKQGRDLRLDQLLYLYMQNLDAWKENSIHRSKLQPLWWYGIVSNQLISLKTKYIEVACNQEISQDLSGKILNFKIKYCSLFMSDLSQSDTLARISQIYSSLENQDQEL